MTPYMDLYYSFSGIFAAICQTCAPLPFGTPDKNLALVPGATAIYTWAMRPAAFGQKRTLNKIGFIDVDTANVRPMISLVVQIERVVDDHFPGWVGCVLTDADGVRHEFVEKAPVIRTGERMSGSHYTRPGHISCVIEEEWVNELGRSLVRVNTGKPWSIASVAGENKFTVFKEQIFPG